MPKTDSEERAAKSKRTKAANKRNLEAKDKELTKARSSARNARIELKQYKAGFEAGMKAMLEAMRSSN